MTSLNYFAYGSNMTESRMLKRKVDVHSRSFAYLNDFRLSFNIPDERFRSIGYANIIEQPGASVEGVLYEVSKETLPRLDKYEIGFDRTAVKVCTENGDRIEAITYISWRSQNAPELVPSDWYLEYLLGGSDILSNKYVQSLEAIETISGIEKEYAGPIRELPELK